MVSINCGVQEGRSDNPSGCNIIHHPAVGLCVWGGGGANCTAVSELRSPTLCLLTSRSDGSVLCGWI
jgi:hypothetical protein